MLIKTLSLGPMQTNCYILYDENSKEAAVFDPADSFDIISSKISESGLKVKYIIITHAHFDHICALDKLKKHTNALVCIGEKDGMSLNSDVLNLSTLFGGKSPLTKPEKLLNDNDVLTLGDEKLEVIATPGHTPGGICVLCNDILISGDTLFYESIGRSDFPGGNGSVLVESVKSKLFTLNENTAVYPGHGPSTTIGHEKINNMIVWWNK